MPALGLVLQGQCHDSLILCLYTGTGPSVAGSVPGLNGPVLVTGTGPFVMGSMLGLLHPLLVYWDTCYSDTCLLVTVWRDECRSL